MRINVFSTRMILRTLIGFLLISASTHVIGSVGKEPTERQKPSSKMLKNLQTRIMEVKASLEQVQEKARTLIEEGAPEVLFAPCYEEARMYKMQLRSLEHEWKSNQRRSASVENEAMWHMPDATIAQLITDFGAEDAIYIVPPDIGAMRLSIIGNMSVPRESWEHMLEWILAEQGIGTQKINAYCKQLFLIEQSSLRFSKILNRAEDLLLVPDHESVCFLLDTQGVDTRATGQSLEKFLHNHLVQIKPFRTSLAIIGRASEVHQAIEIAQFLIQQGENREFRVIALRKISSQDMEAILRSALGNPLTWGHLSFSNQTNELDSVGLQVVPLMSPPGLFLSGTSEEVTRAAGIIEKIEQGLSGPTQREIIRYQTKHTDPVELGKVLSKISKILTTAGPVLSEEDLDKTIEESQKDLSNDSGIAPLAVPGGTLDVTAEQKEANWGSGNVVVDIKTNTLFISIETHLAESLRDLIKKLDVPEKMVRIDFILFEKTLTDRGEAGISLLNIGSDVTGDSGWGATFPHPTSTSVRSDMGILRFFLRFSSDLLGLPPFDVGFNFLVGQEDVQIHANPSLLTMNGTAAVLNLVEETSISVGQTSVPSGSSSIWKDSYVRAQYGIKIRVKPVVHEEGTERYVTLDCDLTFESQRGGHEGRPEVHTRNIKNLCRIKDQESVIIGGLRQKDISDRHNKFPFLGELPILRAFFGYNSISERSTETFVLIRPQVIDAPQGDLALAQREALQRRPGDLLPHLLKRHARRTEGLRAKLCQSLKLLLGR